VTCRTSRQSAHEDGSRFLHNVINFRMIYTAWKHPVLLWPWIADSYETSLVLIMPVPLVCTTLSEIIIKYVRREETKVLFFVFFCYKLVWEVSISFSNLIRITWIFLSYKIWSYKIRKYTVVIEFSFFTKSCTFFFTQYCVQIALNRPASCTTLASVTLEW
jgi:hypothetical protein